MTLTGRQIRAARGLLGWTQADLADAAAVSVNIVENLEGGATDPLPRTAAALREALETAGVVLLARGDVLNGGEGVRLREGGL